MTYLPSQHRYANMTYRRSGRSGLLLPALSLGLWQNFGGILPLETSRAVIHRAFDLGITHFDLATTGLPTGRLSRPSVGSSRRTWPATRRACHLDQGGL